MLPRIADSRKVASRLERWRRASLTMSQNAEVYARFDRALPVYLASIRQKLYDQCGPREAAFSLLTRTKAIFRLVRSDLEGIRKLTK